MNNNTIKSEGCLCSTIFVRRYFTAQQRYNFIRRECERAAIGPTVSRLINTGIEKISQRSPICYLSSSSLCFFPGTFEKAKYEETKALIITVPNSKVTQPSGFTETCVQFPISNFLSDIRFIYWYNQKSDFKAFNLVLQGSKL